MSKHDDNDDLLKHTRFTYGVWNMVINKLHRCEASTFCFVDTCRHTCRHFIARTLTKATVYVSISIDMVEINVDPFYLILQKSITNFKKLFTVVKQCLI